jgi:hypothetical protein
MITVITKVIYPNKEFSDKDDFKSFMVQNFVPESDSLRKYNFKLMDKYGHCFFNLIFKKPNIGILYHRYHTQKEYEGSIELRKQQKTLLNDHGIGYEYKLKEPLSIMNEKDYVSLHKQNLKPIDIKIDVDLFLQEIVQYKNKFNVWGDKFHEFGRFGLPLINMNGLINNKAEPSCWPLDRWNFVNLGYNDTPEDFTKFYTGPFNMNTMVNETDFITRTEVMDLSSLKVLESIEKYMIRSCILKFNTLGHFKPHVDTWKDKCSWLRLWGTTHPESVKLRYKSDEGEKLVWNDIHKTYESYVPEKNIEAGRLYLHDSSIWHDAMSFEDDTYQFFIALDINANLEKNINSNT